MRNIIFTEASQHDISGYTRKYREYYEELYRDSGIWSEDQIVDGYIRESIHREDEIYSAIEGRLSGKYDIIQTSLEVVWIRWRSKHIFVSYEDEESYRIVTRVEIR